MKILQVTEGREFRVYDAEIPTAGPGEVLMRIEAVTTCPQWDLHLRHAEPMFVGHQFVYPYAPGQPGHEATGYVEAVGEGVAESPFAVAVGERVSAWKDAGHQRQGCYAQYVVHKAEHLIPVPYRLSFAATAPVELAMCVGAAVLRMKGMDLIEGRRLGVMGLGPAGLIAGQMLLAEGAAHIVGFDLNPVRWEHATKVGFDETCDPTGEAGERFPLRSSGPVLDSIIDCVGARASVQWAMDRARDTVQLFGVQREEYAFGVRHYTLRLSGYPGHSREAAEYAVSLMERGALDLAPLVTRELPLEAYAEGIDLLERQEAIKICYFPWR